MMRDRSDDDKSRRDQQKRDQQKTDSARSENNPKEAREPLADADAQRRESGQPGGGAGRRDEVGPTGVYPMSGGIPPGHHPEIRTPAAWGQGKRGAEGYDDSGGSELVMRDGQLLGGLTSGPSGEPTIDIHGGDRPPNAKDAAEASDSAKAPGKKKKK